MQMDECLFDGNDTQRRRPTEEVAHACTTRVGVNASAPTDPDMGVSFRGERPNSVSTHRGRAGEGTAVPHRGQLRGVRIRGGERSGAHALNLAGVDGSREAMSGDAELLELDSADDSAKACDEWSWVEHELTLTELSGRQVSQTRVPWIILVSWHPVQKESRATNRGPFTRMSD